MAAATEPGAEPRAVTVTAALTLTAALALALALTLAAASATATFSAAAETQPGRAGLAALAAGTPAAPLTFTASSAFAALCML